MTPWLRERTLDAWGHSAAAVAAVLALGLLLLLVVDIKRLPGPLLPFERALARASRQRRWSLNVLMPAATLAAAAGLFALVWSVAPPTTLVLHSFARAGGRVDALLPRDGRRVLDLGPVVARVLERCRREETCTAGPLPERGAARQKLQATVEDALEGTEPSPMGEDGYYVPGSEGVGLDVAVIESVEMAVVEYWARRIKAAAVRVAPAASEGLSSWELAQTMLDAQRISLQPVDLHRLDDASVRIIAMAGGQLRPGGAAGIWVIVNGKPTAPVRLELAALRGPRGSPDVQRVGTLTVDVAVDGLSSRVLYATGNVAPLRGGCVAGMQTWARDASGHLSGVAELSCRETDVDPRVYFPKAGGEWSALFDWARAQRSGVLREFDADLRALELGIPRVTSGAALPVVLETADALVIAADDATVALARARLQSGTAKAPPLRRVVELDDGPATAFSLKGVSMQGGITPSGAGDLVRGAVLGGDWLEAPVKSAAGVFVATGEVGTGAARRRYALVQLGTSPRAVTDRADPAYSLMVIRAIARSLRWVQSSGADRLVSDTGHVAISPVGPLFSGAEIERMLGARSQQLDLLALAAIGLFFVVSLGQALLSRLEVNGRERT